MAPGGDPGSFSYSKVSVGNIFDNVVEACATITKTIHQGRKESPPETIPDFIPIRLFMEYSRGPALLHSHCEKKKPAPA